MYLDVDHSLTFDVFMQAFGMSECSGPHCMATDNAFRVGSVGKTMVGCRTKIANPDADGNGEMLLGGRHVTMGYLHQPEKTLAAIDSEGWLHSEDIGRLDKDGYLFITGRLKEILITAGGENVAPVPIEDRIKKELPTVSQAVVIGDKQKFLSVLLTVKVRRKTMFIIKVGDMLENYKLYVVARLCLITNLFCNYRLKLTRNHRYLWTN